MKGKYFLVSEKVANDSFNVWLVWMIVVYRCFNSVLCLCCVYVVFVSIFLLLNVPKCCFLRFVQSVSLSSTMGPGVPVDLSSVDPANGKFMRFDL